MLVVWTVPDTVGAIKSKRMRFFKHIHALGSKNYDVKGSRNRPGVAQRVPGGLGSQIFRTFGT